MQPTYVWDDAARSITVAASTARAYVGQGSLAVTFNGTQSGRHQAFVRAPSTPASRSVTFRVWIPAVSGLSAVQPFVLQGSSGGWKWTGAWKSIGSLQSGAWNTITVAVPANVATPLYSLGVEFASSTPWWSGTCHIDAVDW